MLSALEQLAPQQAEAVGRMLLRLQVAQQEGVILAMPYELIID
jgi:hypothetical protein